VGFNLGRCQCFTSKKSNKDNDISKLYSVNGCNFYPEEFSSEYHINLKKKSKFIKKIKEVAVDGDSGNVVEIINDSKSEKENIKQSEEIKVDDSQLALVV
jgi:hypothetical protein